MNQCEQALNKSSTSYEQVQKNSFTSWDHLLKQQLMTKVWTSQDYKVMNNPWTSHEQVMNKMFNLSFMTWSQEQLISHEQVTNK